LEGYVMNEKYVHWLQGAAGGAIALAIVGFTWGDWYTASGAAKQAELAVVTALIPGCVKDVMADPQSAAELKAKRAVDYDDVVRDFRKRVGNPTNLGYQFNRDCGKAIEAIMTKTATKS
jgi:dienelactone hydrolase